MLKIYYQYYYYYHSYYFHDYGDFWALVLVRLRGSWAQQQKSDSEGEEGMGPSDHGMAR